MNSLNKIGNGNKDFNKETTIRPKGKPTDSQHLVFNTARQWLKYQLKGGKSCRKGEVVLLQMRKSLMKNENDRTLWSLEQLPVRILYGELNQTRAWENEKQFKRKKKPRYYNYKKQSTKHEWMNFISHKLQIT